jgi:hypothetical protein
LGQVLRLGEVADQVVHDGDEAVLVRLDELLESAGLVIAHLVHEAHVGVAQGQLSAALAGDCHEVLVSAV